MRKDLTDIVVVLDRSSSMLSCKDEAESGLNNLVDEQKRQPGAANFTLVQFDTNYEVVHDAIPIQSVPKCYLHPRGMTALLDAVGRAIKETGERLRRMPEKDRPGLVLFTVITDGGENSSHEFKKDAIKQMIQHQENKYGWQFNYLGANQDAFAEAGGMGFQASKIADYDINKVDATYGMLSGKMSAARACSMAGNAVDMSYTDAERAAVK